MNAKEICEKAIVNIKEDIVELRKKLHEESDLTKHIKLKNAIEYAEAHIKDFEKEGAES